MLLLYLGLQGGVIINKKKFIILTFFIMLFSLTTTVKTVKADSSINNYIIDNKIKPAAIKNYPGTFNVWTPYRYGVGHPEGIVVHETSEAGVSAPTFADRFNDNWPQLKTYVHAFVDNQYILNIHSTDYAVWGAGPTANARYIQVELCRVGTYDEFARSLSNDAFYIASKLIQYNLPDVAGQTVLSHKQVSNTWHETKHQDPDYYFSTWGYDMDQFNQLISRYYNNLKAYGDVNGQSKNVVRINNKNSSFVPIVSINADGSVTTISNRALSNNTSWYTDQSKTINGVTYHRIASNEWVADQYKI